MLVGLINTCIVIATLVLIGYIILWILGIASAPSQAPLFIVIVALLATYMIYRLVARVGWQDGLYMPYSEEA